MTSLRLGLAFFTVIGLLACASREPYMMPEDVEDNDSTMYFRKAMPDRTDSKPWVFYYKHCVTTGEEVYFSKTSYDCSQPSTY